MQKTILDKTEPYSRAIGWGAAVIPMAVYFYFIAIYTTNTPFTDDLYDALFTLIKYRASNTITEAVRSLSWQYHQHFVLYDRIVYWVFYTLTNTINFRTLVFIGNTSLVIFFLQIVSSVKHYRNLALPAISLVIFSLYFDEDTFGSMGSIQQLGIMAMTLAVFQLLNKSNFIFTACMIAWLAIFTQSNEILIIPLGLLLLLDNIYRGRDKIINKNIIIWTLSSITCLIIFTAFNRISEINDFSLKLSPFRETTTNTDILINFLASLASLPLKSTDNIIYAAPTGAIHLVIICLIFFKSWKVNRPLSLMLAFCFLSLLSAAIIRTPVGPMASVSRYKIFCVGIIAIEVALLTNILNRKYWLIFLFLFAACLNAYSYYMNTEYVSGYEIRRGKTIMQWFYYDEITNLPLANAILDEAYSTDLYNPARDMNYAAIPLSITERKHCPEPDSHNSLTITLRTVPSSRAALLSVQKPHGIAAPIPDSLWLCGQKNYQIVTPKTENTRHLTSPDGQQMVILEKRLFSEDEYLLMHQTDSHVTATNIKINTRFSPRQSRDCERHKEGLQLLLISLYDQYCKS